MGLFTDVINNIGEPYTGGGKGFEYGTHKVKILMAEAIQKKTQKDPNADAINVTVCDPMDETIIGEAILWFHTEGAAKMAVTKVLGLLVHSRGEEKKEAIREKGKQLFGHIESLVASRDIALKLMCETLVGAEAFFFANPKPEYKTSRYGDLWHYHYEDPNAKDRMDKMAQDLISDSTPVSTDIIPNFDDL
jgi:methylthioribose-1-phosphate isomerase